MRVGRAKLPTPEDIQAVEVLGGDRLVRADVQDVDALGSIPQVLDDAGDDAARHHRLAKSDFVGDQELSDGIVLAIESIEHIVDGAPLKRLEGRERRVGSVKGSSAMQWRPARRGQRGMCSTATGTRPARIGIAAVPASRRLISRSIAVS